jgi:hypothetical protein
MINYPKFVQIKGKKYKINTDYRTALKCQEISKSDVSDEERALAIIYLLFGDDGINHSESWNELLQIGLKYLNCGKEVKENNSEEEANMDFEQDWSYIQASFFSDYNLNLSNTEMHWWQFYDLLCGLTEKCILSRIRFVRDFDISQIKDSKEREKWIKQKEQVALKEEEIKTFEERRLDDLFEQQLKGR